MFNNSVVWFLRVLLAVFLMFTWEFLVCIVTGLEYGIRRYIALWQYIIEAIKEDSRE